MPQFDSQFFISQLFWAFLCFTLVFGVFGFIILPKVKRNIRKREQEQHQIAFKIDEFYQEVENINFSKIKKIRQVDHKIKEDIAQAEKLGRKAIRAKQEILENTLKAELHVLEEVFNEDHKLKVLDEIYQDTELKSIVEKRFS